MHGQDPDLAARLAEDRELALLEAEGFLQLACVETDQSKFDEGERLYKLALALFRTHQDLGGEAKALVGLGAVSQARGLPERAIEFYTRGLDIARGLGDRVREGMCLGNLGNVYRIQGQYGRAIEFYVQALQIHRGLGNVHMEGAVVGSLASTYRAQGLQEQAESSYIQAIDIHQRVGCKRSEAIAMANLGNLYQDLGQFDRSLDVYRSAIQIQRDIGDRRGEGVSLGNIGYALVGLERFEEAEVAFREAIQICDEGFPLAAGIFQGALALRLARRDLVDEAHALLEAGEPRVEPMPAEHIKFLCTKGLVHQIAGEIEASRRVLMQSERLAAQLEITDDSDVAQALTELRTVLEAG